MATQEVTPLEVGSPRIGTLELEALAVPYVDLEDEALVPSKLRIGDVDYAYDRSYPIKGHSAIMPGAVSELIAQGRKVLVAERGERYYLYLS